ncbi:hypothetical protein Taro_044726 [Colocasia esculenta]|uniref:Uncharacterized protein n=1 Tax=Colocasia esculenta TaxID=4460 RepID=A0A843X3Q3_COLES|nr:hypothetical protein [Colocasia esculenta]
MSEMDQFASPVDTSVLYAQDSHRSQLVHVGEETEVLKCWEHHRSLGAWPVDPRIINCRWNVPRVEINNPRHVLRLYRSELDHQEDYQRTDSSTSHAGPSEPCAGTPQQPDDAGPSHISPDVMTISQYGLYDVGASQILTDEGMTDTQPPQSMVVSIGNAGTEVGNANAGFRAGIRIADFTILPPESQIFLVGDDQWNNWAVKR